MIGHSYKGTCVITSQIRHLLLWQSIITSLVSGGSGSDFLIIGNPSECGLYDQYEQPLPPAQKKRLLPGTPFRIVNNAQFMGDQITRGMHLSYHSASFYLMLDDKGNPAALPSSALPSTYRNCTPLFDTVLITAPAVKMYPRYPSSGNSTIIKKGERAIRVFSFRGSTYLLRSLQPRYGWSRLNDGSFRRPPTNDRSKKSDYTHLHKRIMIRLENANRRYDTLFHYFNSITRQQKSVPFWDYSENDGNHSYRLNGSRETVAQLEKSTRYIVDDIEAILLGKPFSATCKEGVITIGSR